MSLWGQPSEATVNARAIPVIQVRNHSRHPDPSTARDPSSMTRRHTLAVAATTPLTRSRRKAPSMRWRGGLLVAIPTQNTSRTCPECGHVAAENRKTQAKFACVACGFSAPADWVAACNIREAGLASLACTHPSGAVSPSCQEPTEGFPAWQASQ